VKAKVQTVGANTETLSPDFFSEGIKQLKYQRDRCLILSGNYMEKQRV
jgi:hypothetical protein